jgi:cytochrome c peroxidase
MGDYFTDRGNVTDADKGRYNITHSLDNMHEFRVPTLRNVALTAPYFHDGSAQTLEEAIRVMVKYQLGRPMPAEDLNDIAAFLRTLTGQYQGKSL